MLQFESATVIIHMSSNHIEICYDRNLNLNGKEIKPHSDGHYSISVSDVAHIKMLEWYCCYIP